MIVMENEERDLLLADQEIHHLIWILSRNCSIPQTIPSWTGFNITIRNNQTQTNANISYLQSIDAPATEMSTIYEILDRCLAIKEKLNLDVIVCVFDQAMYAKAVEIKWKDPIKYKSCIIMLGMFHMLMMYLGIIGKRFKDAGMRDVLIQSEVISGGSVDRALSGKMYNRAVRCNKLFYEALHRLLLQKMEESVNSIEEQLVIDDVYENIVTFKDDMNENVFTALKESNEIKRFHESFIDSKNSLVTTGSTLAQFWLTYLEMIELLLNTLYAVRTGSWSLLLECIRDIARMKDGGMTE